MNRNILDVTLSSGGLFILSQDLYRKGSVMIVKNFFTCSLNVVIQHVRGAHRLGAFSASGTNCTSE
jgi:hypothetical protein